MSTFKCMLREESAYRKVKMQCLYVAGNVTVCLLWRGVCPQEVSACRG